MKHINFTEENLLGNKSLKIFKLFIRVSKGFSRETVILVKIQLILFRQLSMVITRN